MVKRKRSKLRKSSLRLLSRRSKNSRKKSASKYKSRSKTTSLADLKARLKALNPDYKSISRPKSLPKGRPKRKAKKASRRFSNYKFPSVPKNDLNTKSKKSGKKTDKCSYKLAEMRKKYKLGQKIMNEVDHFMGSGK